MHCNDMVPGKRTNRLGLKIIICCLKIFYISQPLDKTVLSFSYCYFQVQYSNFKINFDLIVLSLNKERYVMFQYVQYTHTYICNIYIYIYIINYIHSFSIIV